jgi:conjugative relaxase-like TrwC/TraI family protein
MPLLEITQSRQISASVQHPQTEHQLVRHRTAYEYEDNRGKAVKAMEHRAGWDATFSAAKSVSLTALVGGDDRVREAHRESVRVNTETHMAQSSGHRLRSILCRHYKNFSSPWRC